MMFLVWCGVHAIHRLSSTPWSLQPVHAKQARRTETPRLSSTVSAIPTWSELESVVPTVYRIDGVATGFQFYRDDDGWCPQCEQVWLTLELKGLHYEHRSVHYDQGASSCRPRASPLPVKALPALQLQNGRVLAGVSSHIVRALDALAPEVCPLWHGHGVDAREVTRMATALHTTLPSIARRCERAEYLFVDDRSALPAPLPRETFEAALDATEALLCQHAAHGPFFCGARVCAADIMWAPFLERYAAQLPCLHSGLQPRNSPRWPRLASWYAAMDAIPAYACRVKGNDASWRKVLSRPPWWPTGWAPPTLVPPRLGTGDVATDGTPCAGVVPAGIEPADIHVLWRDYARSRQEVALSPALQAVAVIVANRQAIVDDARRRPMVYGRVPFVHDAFSAEQIETALRTLASLLTAAADDRKWRRAPATPAVKEVAAYLDERLCVPRDMGAPPAAEVHRVRVRLEQ